MRLPGAQNNQKIFTVSQLTENIKSMLEKKFSFVWITGEISNLRTPVSGHCYFTLKDSNAQINAVMFRGQVRSLKFAIEDGMNVTGFGRITVYPPRGVYQIILEYLEPSGVGALQAAFEQLKARLSKEGLFDDCFKKPIPFLPKTVCLITSPTGSVVHDMIHVIERRFQNVNIEIIPVKVQGDSAEPEIVRGIELLNARQKADVAILARGGGSLEDLSAFNSEAVARAIFASQIPIISAIGHETDFTISDFVADLRAPTPSAAAELVVPEKSALTRRQQNLARQLHIKIKTRLDAESARLTHLSRRLRQPIKRIDDLRLRADDYAARFFKGFSRLVQLKRDRLKWRVQSLYANNPLVTIRSCRNTIQKNKTALFSLMASNLNIKRLRLKTISGRLHALSPLAVLDRGYSIVRSLPDHTIITDSDTVSVGRLIEVLPARGRILCRVERKKSNGEKKL